ncbi:NYN domain-containing protein [Cellulomonas chitinilytica]|uniref:NYN domain-containing protein n=1 Tax=Cellulomonas chitinilytica TaxID=398759 RepID=A0A919P4N1_9CELL|nr:NYN domain-containing protein [Cellulomonas chitinilytica]GIG23411.1 NYN domain-containing protein [Cellulomonas chitinilytica]
MTTTDAPPTGSDRRYRCALFVDFDNVYIGLRRLDPDAAEAFATDPGHWLSELEQGTDSDGDFSRRFLIRACYLNPSVFSRYRPNFTRAGFQVVDCPSLTQQGKSSADINLVLDAVDALAADTRYEEFVIASADADFTPLALRCRAADRRVTIITSGPAASAYRAVADTVITADDLAELVTSSALAGALSSVLDGSPTDTPAPAGVDVRAADGPAPDAVVPSPTLAADDAEPSTRPARAVTTPAHRAILQRVRSADRPLPLGVVAQVAQKADPTLATTGWGPGGFFAWLTRTVPEVGASSRPPGFVWDPARFGEADLPGAVADTDPTALQQQVVNVTDTPGLSQANYRVLLESLAADLKAHPFERATTSKRVRNACQEAGAAVGRSTVDYVIACVLYGGLELTSAVSATDLAAAWADYVVSLSRGARMELSAGDVAAIRSWVGGGLLDR